MSKSHHTQIMRKNSVRKLLFGHVQILETMLPYSNMKAQSVLQRCK